MALSKMMRPRKRRLNTSPAVKEYAPPAWTTGGALRPIMCGKARPRKLAAGQAAALAVAGVMLSRPVRV
jgi:hypothetical protein